VCLLASPLLTSASSVRAPPVLSQLLGIIPGNADVWITWSMVFRECVFGSSILGAASWWIWMSWAIARHVDLTCV